MRRLLAAATWAVLVIAVAAGGVDAQLGAAGAPQFMLSGVVVVEGGGRAWLQEPQLTQNQPVAVRPGESIGPYRLTKILDDRVEMVGPSGTFSVLLAGAPGPATGAATSPPRPSPPAPAQDAPPPPDNPGRVVILPPGPPRAPLPPGTPRVDFESLLRGVTPSR
jgi:hypothetical protein